MGGPTAAPTAAQTEPPKVVVTLPPSSPDPTHSPVDGPFRDPEGMYEMRVDPGWVYQAGGFVDGVEFWFLGPPEGGFAPNVNALTQQTGGLSLADYLDLSVDQAPNLMANFELIDRAQVKGASGRLGVMEYTGNLTGGPRLHFLAVIAMTDGRAVVVTLTAPRKSFRDWRAEVEPFMLTLRPT